MGKDNPNQKTKKKYSIGAVILFCSFLLIFLIPFLLPFAQYFGDDEGWAFILIPWLLSISILPLGVSCFAVELLMRKIFFLSENKLSNNLAGLISLFAGFTLFIITILIIWKTTNDFSGKPFVEILLPKSLSLQELINHPFLISGILSIFLSFYIGRKVNLEINSSRPQT
jgi:hypothetical protein